MSDNVVELDIQLTFRDCLRSVYWYSWRRRQFTLPFLIAYLIFNISVTVFVLLVAPQLRFQLLVLWAIACYIAASPYLLVRRLTKTNKTVLAPKRWSFSSDGVGMIGSNSSSSTRWENIRRAYESKHTFLLELSALQFFTIPKRCFISDRQVQAFKTLVRASLQENARFRP